ncbi:MAG: hypothetical protein ABIK43_06725, partial [candidate division WOR-3 bacterium]
LTVEAGTTLKLQPRADIQVRTNGALALAGTADAPVTVTSAKATPARGGWQGSEGYADSVGPTHVLTPAIVEYGGGDGYGNIRIQNALPTVTGDSIGHSAAYGIHLSGSEYPDRAALLANNYFYDNASGDVNQP